MSYQVFTRYSGSGTNRASKPRRLLKVETPREAIDYCTAANEARSRDAVRKGFFYEWTSEQYYREAWG
jgi:hypothetical protein